LLNTQQVQFNNNTTKRKTITRKCKCIVAEQVDKYIDIIANKVARFQIFCGEKIVLCVQLKSRHAFKIATSQHKKLKESK